MVVEVQGMSREGKSVSGKDKSVVLFSGGPDSLAALEVAREESEVVGLVHLERSPGRSLAAAQTLSHSYELSLVSIPYTPSLPLSYFRPLGERVPYLADRNLLFLTLASIYVKTRAFGFCLPSLIYTGFCLTGREAEGTASYDVSGKFVSSLNALLALDQTYPLQVRAPYADRPKTDALSDLLYRFLSPVHLTWSCYEENPEGGFPCGRCAGCQHRIEAFREVGVRDPLEYGRELDWPECISWKEYQDGVA